ncbi:hypothetical protein [Thermococcus sp. 21S7]|uniref:hypothetical protein n=1 Tax=Thermococcus sp. 21S7 TaxID=1638221 RepID=UPI00143B4F4F|nr:hypothetical protein [Thermococcus sp. 21S7]NJE61431.1 hypothetical protein [Thermococcus sp. 21S7]
MVAVKPRNLAVVLGVLLLTAYSLTWLHERTLAHSGNSRVFWLEGENVTADGSNLSSILGDFRTLGFVERERNDPIDLRIRYVPQALWATAGQCSIEGPLLITLSPNQTVTIEHISVRVTLTGDGWADEIWPDFSDPNPVIIPPKFEGGPGCLDEIGKSLCARFWALKPLWGREVRLYLHPDFTLLQNGSTCNGSLLLEFRVEYLVRTGLFTSRREAMVLRLPVKFHIHNLPEPTSRIVVRYKNETTVYPRP